MANTTVKEKVNFYLPLLFTEKELIQNIFC